MPQWNLAIAEKKEDQQQQQQYEHEIQAKSEKTAYWRKIGKGGPTEIWTRIAGFRVQSANHYTMGPYVEKAEIFQQFLP